jgi:hypothetical protein
MSASDSSMSPMTPPPGQSGGAPPADSPATQQGAPPAPASPNPAMQQGTQLVIGVVNGLRAIAKAYPKAAPIVTDINARMRELLPIVMQSQSPGEVQAPPT